ncbi:MAG: hypothetical protein K5771_06735, partial [Oscillospiraceae bacterium]|nr:hypothetical protein [Oscillospiraceae bacterium]
TTLEIMRSKYDMRGVSCDIRKYIRQGFSRPIVYPANSSGYRTYSTEVTSLHREQSPASSHIRAERALY